MKISMKRRHSLLGSAHALHALTSLVGIMAMPALIVRAGPEAPMARPFVFIQQAAGSWLPLVWVFGSLVLWLLLLSRIYDFKGLWAWAWGGRQKDFQSQAPQMDSEQARLAASCLRLE